MTLEPPAQEERRPRIRALVFDMDGTLTDSDPLHREAFALALAPYGLTMTEGRYKSSISGRTNAEIGHLLFPDHPVEHHRLFADEKERLFRDLAETLTPVRGLARLLAHADARGLPLALVTNAPRANAEHMVGALGLASRFRVTVLGEEVARPKPDPMPYALALKRLGLAAHEAIAFEDSVPGVRSARGAGLTTFGLTTSQSAAALIEAGAHHAIADFEDLLLWRLLDESDPP